MIILSILDLNLLDLILNFFDENDIYDFIEIIFLGFGMGVLTYYIYIRFLQKWITLGNSKEDNNKKSVLYFKKEEKDID